MEMREGPTQIGRRTRVLDDLKLLINSRPAAAVRAQAIADIKSVLAKLSHDLVTKGSHWP